MHVELIQALIHLCIWLEYLGQLAQVLSRAREVLSILGKLRNLDLTGNRRREC